MFHPLKIIDNESEVSCGKKIGRYVKTVSSGIAIMHVYFTSEDVTTNPVFGIAELSSLTINEFPELLS